MSERWWREGDSRFWKGFGAQTEEAQTIQSLREEWVEIAVIDDFATVYQTPGGLFLVAEDECGLIRIERLDD